MSKDKKSRAEIIWLHHNMLVAGHGGRQKMTELVTINYWWPEVTKDVEKYVEECSVCQRMKNKIEVPVGKLMTNEVLEKLQMHLIIDFIIILLLVAEKNTILVVCDRLSKIAHFVTTMEGTLVEVLARLFRDNVQKLHRLPKGMINNRGPQFVKELTKKLNKILEIKTKLLTAFHLQTDRQTEQMNQELEQFFTKYKQRDWLEWLAIAEFAINTRFI